MMVTSNMITSNIKYYFSIKALTFATLFIGAIITFTLSLFFMFYKESLIYATLSLIPLIVVMIGLPNYFMFLYCAVKKKPALELTKDLLIDNSKGKTYKWTDIKNIVYKRFTGFRTPPGGYIEVTFYNSENKVTLPNNVIKGKTEEVLGDLQNYLKSSKGNSKL
jgi:hypothetical protein